MKLKTLISTSTFGRIDRQPLEMLASAGIEYNLNPYERKLQPEETISLLQDIDGLIAGTELLDHNILSQTPKLKVISRCGTGLDNVDLDAAAELGIEVFNTPDAITDAVAELTLGGILNLIRQVGNADRLIRQGGWQKPMGGLLREKTVGIIGLGRVGKALTKLLQPFSVTILAYDIFEDGDFAQQHNVQYCSLEQLLAQADIITVHLSYSGQVWHLLDRSCLELLKPGAFLVNCARGGIIDEDALHELLQEGKLAGAYLDTFEREPYRGPLTTLDNVLLTPHIGSYAAESRLRMEIEAVENLLRFFQKGQT